MDRICIKCHSRYDGTKWSTLCPTCAAESKRNIRRVRVCQTCGAEFVGMPRTKHCPDCMAERRKQQARAAAERKRTGNVRKLGSIDKCVKCGKEYVVNGALQKYCPSCAPEAYLEVDRAQARKWIANNMDYVQRGIDRTAAVPTRTCPVCGKEFKPHNASVTCSSECAAKHKAASYNKYVEEHREHLNAINRNRMREKINAMTPEEYAEYRAKVNAVARENYKKRKAKGDKNHDKR